MTNNKQQTAVDILCGKLAMKLGIPQAITFYIDHAEEIAEAKAMHKEETIKLYYAYEDYVLREEGIIKTFGQFYNETFGGNND